jgi:hypothetical protein
VEHYILAMIYPAGLTRGMQMALGTAVLMLTLCAYAAVLLRRARVAPAAAHC